MKKITRDTRVLDLIENHVATGYLDILRDVLRQLQHGQNPHVAGIDHTYPARDLITAAARVEGCEECSIWEEVNPKWLKRVADLLDEIAKEQARP